MTQRALIVDRDHWTLPHIEDGSLIAVEINGVTYTERIQHIDGQAIVDGRPCTAITLERAAKTIEGVATGFSVLTSCGELTIDG